MKSFGIILIVGFSRENFGGKNDEMNNDLTKTIVQATAVLKPEFVVFENVNGLLRKN